MYHAYAFVDGGHVEAICQKHGAPLPNPAVLADDLRKICGGAIGGVVTSLVRTTYYDARPDEEVKISARRRAYWDAIEALDDTHLGFGYLRGQKRRQKAVDTLAAVDMLVGAFTGIYQVAILISGDADFVPVVEEIRRKGVIVLLGANEATASEDLCRAVDRVHFVMPGNPFSWPQLKGNGAPFLVSELAVPDTGIAGS